MKKKVLGLLLAMSMTVTVLGGCGGTEKGGNTDASAGADADSSQQTEEDGSGDSGEETPTGDEVTLKVLMSSGWTEGALERVASQLSEKGITLDIEAYDWNTYEGKQRLAGTSKGGEYDVIFLPGNAVNIFAQADALVPLDDVVEELGYTDDSFYGSVRKFSKSDDNWYIVPYSAESMVYYYRTDLISEDQLPTTIDEMYDLGVSLTSGDTYGLAIPAGPGEAACSFWSYFLWSYGGDYFDDTWHPTLNTPEAVEAAEMFAKIAQDCAPAGISTWQNEETVAAFQSGQLAAMVNWPGYWSQVTDPEQSKVADNVAIAPVPAGPEGARPRFGTWGLGVTANCKDVEAGKEVVKAFCSMEGLESRLDLCPSPVRELNEVENIQDINYTIPANCATLDEADERPPIPELNLYIPAVGAAINSIVSGASAQETLDSLNDEVQAIMQDGGYY